MAVAAKRASVTSFLRGANAGDPAALAALLEQGLPLEDVAYMAVELKATPATLLRYIDIPERTVYRRLQDERLNPDESRRLARVARLMDAASAAFADPEAARKWLTSEGEDGSPAPLTRAAVGVDPEVVYDELARLVGTPDEYAQATADLLLRLPVPTLPQHFSASAWVRDTSERGPLPTVSCSVAATIAGRAASRSITVRVRVDASAEELGRLIYPRFVTAVAEIRAELLIVV
jgi:putative toxin-antitoxin system antitoxin component (TIGR02293 family)